MQRRRFLALLGIAPALPVIAKLPAPVAVLEAPALIYPPVAGPVMARYTHRTVAMGFAVTDDSLDALSYAFRSGRGWGKSAMATALNNVLLKPSELSAQMLEDLEREYNDTSRERWKREYMCEWKDDES